MKAVIKRCLFVGISLTLAALTARRFKQETELEGNAVKPGGRLEPKLRPAIGPQLNAAKPDPIRPISPVLPGTQPSPFSATTVTFNGTVVRNGSRFALRETAGELYPLDSAGRAWCFEGEDVRVTGKIDLSTRLLHVDAIEPVAL